MQQTKKEANSTEIIQELGYDLEENRVLWVKLLTNYETLVTLSESLLPYNEHCYWLNNYGKNDTQILRDKSKTLSSIILSCYLLFHDEPFNVKTMDNMGFHCPNFDSLRRGVLVSNKRKKPYLPESRPGKAALA